VDRALSRVIGAALRRWTDIDVRDYESLLELSGEYGVMELEVDERDWVAGRSLSELALRDEGIVVLGIHRGGSPYIGAPDGETLVLPGDTLVLYARSHRLCELDERVGGAAGDRAHAEAVAEQDEIEAMERSAGSAGSRARQRVTT
jgi:uncharacterized protein with PhoU and TrkA domain